MKYTVIVLLAVFAVVSLAQTNCQPVITTADGKKFQFDLTPLWHAAGEDDKLLANDDNMNKYYMNICGETTTGNTGECKGASVCQESLSGDDNNAGKLSTQTFFAPNDTSYDPGKVIGINYTDGTKCSNGDARQTKIIISCDPNVQNPLIDLVLEESHCAYSVHITSLAGCGTAAGGAGDAGEIVALVILLVLICGLILYFVIGAIYQKKVKDAANLREMVIHNEFWCALPSLIKDGVLFIFHCCKKGDYLSV